MDSLTVGCECTDCQCVNDIMTFEGEFGADELIVCDDCLFGVHREEA